MFQDECPKRVVPCPYCELELAFDEMASHTNYCGTRTEMCALCSQYIMHKDLQRHEESGCTYPTPKPNNTATESSRQRVPAVDEMAEMDANGFALDEISRLMRRSSLNQGPPMVTRNNIAARRDKRTNEITRGSGRGGGRQRDVNDLRTYHDETLAQHLAQDLGHAESLGVPNWLRGDEPFQPLSETSQGELLCFLRFFKVIFVGFLFSNP